MTESKLSTLLKLVSTSLVVSKLSVLIGTDSSKFLTSSDVAFAIMKDKGLDLKHEDFVVFNNQVNARLSSCYSRKTNEVKRTDKRIKPGEVCENYKSLKSSYGYRVGIAVSKQVIDQDVIDDHKKAADQACMDYQERMDVILGWMDDMNTHQLIDLQMDALSRIQQRNQNAKREASDLRARLGKFEEATKAICELKE